MSIINIAKKNAKIQKARCEEGAESLTDELELDKNSGYRKLIKIGSLVAIIFFLITFILGYLLNFLFYSILIYITILLSFIGYFGGVWLWKYLASSELIKGDMKRIIKGVGILALIGFIGFISISIYISFNADFSLLQLIVTIANYLFGFMTFYCIGYLISIWRTALVSEKTVEHNNEGFKLDWAIIKPVLKRALPCCAVIGLIMVIIGISLGQILTLLFYYGIILLLIVGLCVGYLVWEHLKKSNLISGSFQMQLKWISVAFLIALAGLTLYGVFISSIVPIIQLYRDLILYYSIFVICLFFYFLGLYISLIKSK
jgi:hypothetical protein